VTVLVTLLMLALVGGSIVWTLRSKELRADAWKRFAASRQLGYADGRIAGVVSGFTIAVLTESRDAGRSTRHFTVVRCALNGALPEGFKLARETVTDKLSQMIGKPDHQLGVPEIDSTFLLDRLDDDARRVLSHRPVQERLLTLVEKYPGLRVGNGVLQLETEKLVPTEEGLAEMLGDAVSLAITMERAKSRSR
jgi:hypothetical protein